MAPNRAEERSPYARKKSVHFGDRSHTPKISQKSGPGSPRRNNALENGEDNEFSDNRHEDLITRSSMYAHVKCPHCERVFSDKAA